MEIGRGLLEKIQLNNGEVFFLEVGAFECPFPRLNKRMLILSPLDNCVIQRKRLKALFEFEYQLECYVPEPKRQHSYFYLPLLFRDEFIGRMDCKVHRKVGHLEIKPLYLENDDFKEELVIESLVDAIKQFCYFQKCDTVALGQVIPKKSHPN